MIIETFLSNWDSWVFSFVWWSGYILYTCTFSCYVLLKYLSDMLECCREGGPAGCIWRALWHARTNNTPGRLSSACRSVTQYMYVSILKCLLGQCCHVRWLYYPHDQIQKIMFLSILLLKCKFNQLVCCTDYLKCIVYVACNNSRKLA